MQKVVRARRILEAAALPDLAKTLDRLLDALTKACPGGMGSGRREGSG